MNLASPPPHSRPSPAPTRVCTPAPRLGRAARQRGRGLRGGQQAGRSQVGEGGLSRGDPSPRRNVPDSRTPVRPKCWPGLKFKMPTISLAHPPTPRGAALRSSKSTASAGPRAPRPRPRPRPRAPGAALLASLAWGQGATYGRRAAPGAAAPAPRPPRQACHLPQLRDASRAGLLRTRGPLLRRTFTRCIKTFQRKALSCLGFLGTIQRYEM